MHLQIYSVLSFVGPPRHLQHRYGPCACPLHGSASCTTGASVVPSMSVLVATPWSAIAATRALTAASTCCLQHWLRRPADTPLQQLTPSLQHGGSGLQHHATGLGLAASRDGRSLLQHRHPLQQHSFLEHCCGVLSASTGLQGRCRLHHWTVGLVPWREEPHPMLQH